MLFPLPAGQGIESAGIPAHASPIETRRGVAFYDLPARSLLNRTAPGMPFRWTVNPYRGCEFGCKYCYARYTHEYMNLSPEQFEGRVYIKRFSPAAFRAGLCRIATGEAIVIGSATDPYQPVEREAQSTRTLLKILAGERGRSVSLTTKSDLIVRDLDLLRAIAAANSLHVNFTVTTLDDRIARVLEPRALRPVLRLRAMRAVAGAGIPVGIFPNPVMPCLTDSEENLDAVARAASAAGARFMYCGAVRVSRCSRGVFFSALDRHFPKAAARCREILRGRARSDWVQSVSERVRGVRARYRLASGSPVSPMPAPEPQLSLFG
ncbi:MAG: SPL family radical SAM protein [bacterium]